MSNLITCEICGISMTGRLNGSHLKSKHSITIDEYIEKFPTAHVGKLTLNLKVYTCKICNKQIKGTSSLSRHLKFHNESLESYHLKYVLNNNRPLCKCGCKNKTSLIYV
jgi:predicted transcriptional regulator